MSTEGYVKLFLFFAIVIYTAYKLDENFFHFSQKKAMRDAEKRLEEKLQEAEKKAKEKQNNPRTLLEPIPYPFTKPNPYLPKKYKSPDEIKSETIREQKLYEEWRKKESERLNKLYDAKEFRDYLSGRAKGWMPTDTLWGNIGQYEFIKSLSPEKAEELLSAFIGTDKPEQRSILNKYNSPMFLKYNGFWVDKFLKEHNIEH